MSKLFIQVMDSRIVLAAGSLKGQDEYTFQYKKELEYGAFAQTPESLAKMVKMEFVEAGLIPQNSKREDIDIVFSRRGILFRIVKVPFMPLDDLEKMMEFEKGEYLSANPEEYEIRYKIIDKYDENGQIFWDIAVAGIEKSHIQPLVLALDSEGFRINFIEILPGNYEGIFSKIQEKDLIIFEDDGDFSRICILKNGRIFLYADFPIDNKEMFANQDYSKLFTEIRGYLEYYSSRNFGKSVEALVLLRNYGSEEIRENILGSFTNLKIYTSNDLCNLLVKNNEECSEEKFVETYYAIMSILNLRNRTNFICLEYLAKEKERNKKRLIKILSPLVAILLIIPVWLLYSNNQESNDEVARLMSEQEILNREIKEIEPVEAKIKEIENKISVFGDLFNNSYKRVINIRNIEEYIPSEITYTKISLLFSDYKTTEDGQAQPVEDLAEPPKVKIYENVPNLMIIEGRTHRLDAISRFVYQLNNDPLIEVVSMEQIGWLPEEKINSFLITVEIKEGQLK